MPANPLISVVLSFRNEALVIPELIRRLQAVFTKLGMRYELIFVNDASTDDSLALLYKHRELDPNIKIINISRRFGVTPCVLAGMRSASGDAVVYLDSDLQDPPELIPALIEKWNTGADIVHTTRTARHGESRVKMLITQLAYKTINSAADIYIPANTGDFKLIARRALDAILALPEFDPFMRGLVAWVGFNQTYVFYEREPRYAGQTHFSLWRSLQPYQEFIRGLTVFSSMPLYFALFMGIFVSLGTFTYLLVIMIRQLMGAHLPEWSAPMVITLFLGGFILLSLGILGIYVGRIHREIKGRPNYIVSEMVGFDNKPKPPAPVQCPQLTTGLHRHPEP
jgi:dolichol-phosphate mannosyltransferase